MMDFEEMFTDLIEENEANYEMLDKKLRKAHDEVLKKDLKDELDFCKYCENGKTNKYGVETFERLNEGLGIFKTNGVYFISGPFGLDVSICYCPKCGRHLSD